MQTKNILKWALILSIVIVLNLFFNFAISTAYKAPQFGDFCTTENVRIAPENRTVCEKEGGKWYEEGAGSKSFCDPYFTCQREYDKTREIYNRNVFLALVVLGVLSLVGGIIVMTSSSAVSLGLSLGGVLSFVIASIRYWSDMDEYLRVIILGLALITLIFIAIKKFKD